MATNRPPRAVISLDEFQEPINFMIFGDAGSGKSELLSALPGKVLVLAVETGVGVIKRALVRKLGEKRAAVEAKRFSIMRVLNWKDLEDVYVWGRDGGFAKYDWVAIDSATSLDERAMRAAMETAVQRNPEKRDIDLPDRGEHQKRQNAMKRMVSDFNELPQNVMWLANAMRREDKEGNEIVVPFITGKDYEVSAWVAAQMSTLLYMGKKSEVVGKATVTRRFLIADTAEDAEHTTYWAKDRFSVFPSRFNLHIGDKQVTDFGALVAECVAVAGSGAAPAKDDPALEADLAEDDIDEDDVDEDDPPLEPDPADKRDRGVPNKPARSRTRAAVVPTAEPEEEPTDEDDEPAEDELGWMDEGTLKAFLQTADKAEILAASERFGVSIKGLTKAIAVDAIVDAAFAEDEPEPDEVDEDEDEDGDEDEPDEAKGLGDMDEPELSDFLGGGKDSVVEAAKHFGVTIAKGMKIQAVIDAIMEAAFPETDESELDDDDFDEDADEADEPEEELEIPSEEELDAMAVVKLRAVVVKLGFEEETKGKSKSATIEILNSKRPQAKSGTARKPVRLRAVK